MQCTCVSTNIDLMTCLVIFCFFIAPSSTVVSLNVTTPFSRIVKVTWSPPPSSEINGVIQFYSVNFFITETHESFEFKTNKTQFIKTDAHPFYTYSVNVSAVTVAYGPYTPVINVITPQDGRYLFT